MNHEHRHLSDEQLLMLSDGEAPPVIAQRGAHHVAACASCAARQRRLSGVLDEAAGAHRAEPAPPFAEQAVRARLIVAMAQERPSGTRARAALALVAAAVVALVTMERGPGETTSAAPFVMREAGALPIAALTPGATWEMSTDALCQGARYTQPVAPDMRQAVLAAYEMEGLAAAEYELDYLVTPELGGATDTRNLWPQRYLSRTWSALVKDDLESLLPQLVCAGEVDLATAQRDLAVDWIGAYRKYFKTDRPLPRDARRAFERDNDTYRLATSLRVPRVKLVNSVLTARPVLMRSPAFALRFAGAPTT